MNGVPTPLRDTARAIVACAVRRADSLLLTNAVGAYWRALPVSSTAERRALLRSLRPRVRSGELTTRAFVPCVLGEPDGALVREAVLDYIGVFPVSLERRRDLLADALDWMRRSLAVNRAAIFAALLLLDDPVILEQLAPARLRLEPAEREAVWRCVANEACAKEHARDFMAEWRALLAT